jgi:hypothetical protein
MVVIRVCKGIGIAEKLVCWAGISQLLDAACCHYFGSSQLSTTVLWATNIIKPMSLGHEQKSYYRINGGHLTGLDSAAVCSS